LQLDIIVPVFMSCALLWWVSRGMNWTTRLVVAVVTPGVDFLRPAVGSFGPLAGRLAIALDPLNQTPARVHDIGGATNC
jgi:uncharacterized protein YggT (Ycf19 family)